MAKLTREDVEQIISIAHEKGQTPDLQDLDLRSLDLRGLNFLGANLSGVDLREADLRQADLSRVNLSCANLRDVDLHGQELSAVKFMNADLMGTNLSMTYLVLADFTDASLRKANLSGANLNRVYLTRADLSQANIRKVEFTETRLDNVNFSQAIMEYNKFGNVDLRTAQGLESIEHRGPSYVDTKTLHSSKGQISNTFLRGCGLSDWEIEASKLYQPDLTSAEFTDITYKIHELRVIAIHYYSCFISYSSKDETFAQRLYADLQQKGVRCWYAPEDMKIGDKIRPVIDQSIRLHDKLLLILSENSLNSFWVESEVEKAFEEERQRKQIVLFPVRLDEAVMDTNQPWAAEIRRTRHIGDFSQWKDHDAYQEAFERLLRDLKAEG